MKRCIGLHACLLFLILPVLTGCSNTPVDEIKQMSILFAQPSIVGTIGEIFDGGPYPKKLKWLWSYKKHEDGIGEKITVSGTIPRTLWRDQQSQYTALNDSDINEANIEFTFSLYGYKANFGSMQAGVGPATITYLSKAGKSLEPACEEIGGFMVEEGCRKEIGRYEAMSFLSYLSKYQPLPF